MAASDDMRWLSEADHLILDNDVTVKGVTMPVGMQVCSHIVWYIPVSIPASLP